MEETGVCMQTRMFVPPAAFEANVHRYIRAAWYLFFMVYLFLGVAIISDVFMSAIEAITSRKRRVWMKNGHRRTEKVWNDTVATLSLMALGSSAPEIFLSLMELLKKDFHAGDLGPSTIVGSAAFNLFCIIAVCIIVIPDGEDRLIENYKAFLVTAAFSLGAYMWMVFILVIYSRDRVEVWEAATTLLFLPALIWVAYSVESGWIAILIEPLLQRLGYGSDDAGDAKDVAIISWAMGSLHVQTFGKEQEHEVLVKRTGGLSQTVSCNCRTERLSAVPGFDFNEAEGELKFGPGETMATIKVTFPVRPSNRVSKDFILILENAEGASFDAETDGGEEAAILPVTLATSVKTLEHSNMSSSLTRFMDSIVGIDHLRFAWVDWVDQVKGVFYVNGSAEEQGEASPSDWFFHFLSLPWRLVFMFVPPTSYFGGWLCFIIAIACIGGLTGVVSDVAELFGCCIELPDIVTAISIVALGTSMPDLFASVSAATEDPTADASIVNVTGSNSVNVFLGLGLPWTMAALKWSQPGARTADWEMRYPYMAKTVPGAAFVVQSGNLGFSVLIFSGCCMMAIILLFLRRKYLGAELGGPKHAKWASGAYMVLLWLAYVGLSTWRVLRCQGASEGHMCKASVQEQGTVVFSVGFLLLVAFGWPVGAICRHKRSPKDPDEERLESPLEDPPLPPPPEAPPRAAAAAPIKHGFDGPPKTPHEVLQRKAGNGTYKPVLMRTRSTHSKDSLPSVTSVGGAAARGGTEQAMMGIPEERPAIRVLRLTGAASACKADVAVQLRVTGKADGQ